ncbi:uncharacterized protein B0P05DRAFT_501614 [Gilbertella persicaria]|uniref:uncharacterized protein n=1 Tax=Gilbertella persicaria TaxID=101096 RepID=UPI00221E9BA9|nr:uncharacterized protein B0P05DRAFT_501614 [Gilbertella persicaria]KAI8098178.1 hypothetical protein B0P05DRAFT_501614 [Gilbertella persicaria]
MAHHRTCISDLPSELLQQILQYILEAPDGTCQDLLNCALQCRSWSYHALQLLWHKPLILKPQTWLKFSKTLALLDTYIDYAPLVRRINLSAVPEYIGDESLLTLSMCKQLDRITLTGCMHISENGLQQFLSKDTGRYLLSMDLSEIKHITDETVLLIAETCRSLQGLNLTVNPVKEEECLGVTDKNESIMALTMYCPNLLEIDVINCNISNQALTSIFEKSRELRELKVNNCQFLNDHGFICSSLTTRPSYYDQLRILDLTNIVSITDRTVDCITQSAPKIRNLILNKCVHITDKSVDYLTRLGRYLHYIHLGSCKNITDQAIIHLTSKCTRIRYIDLASCHRLGDDTVVALAALPKLKRIGLVKCHRITNRAIIALTRHARTSVSLERIHLSYCEQLTVQAIAVLVIHCRRLTHLSLSFIPAFQHEEFQRFCRPPPKEYNAELQRTFCVFSGQNVHDLRSYLKSSAYVTQQQQHLNMRRLYLQQDRLDELSEGLQRTHVV